MDEPAPDTPEHDSTPDGGSGGDGGSATATREDLYTHSLEMAVHLENRTEAMRVQLMLVGFDAMILEEEAALGHPIHPEDPCVRAFHLHQAAITHTSWQTVRSTLEDADTLRTKLPKTWAVFSDGGCSFAQASRAADQVHGLSVQHLDTYDTAAADYVTRYRAGIVEQKLARLRDRLEPEATIDRHERASNRRYVRARPEGDGMGVLEIHSTATDIAALSDALRRAAIDAHGREGECRHLGALMADLASDVLLHGLTHPTPDLAGLLADPSYPTERLGDLKVPHRKAITAQILVTVSAGTATGASNEPGEVAGFGTIDADLARRIIQHTHTWTRILTDPVDDTVIGIDSTDRYISTGLKKLIHLRNPTCVGDDCGLPLPAHRCDLDHITRIEHDGRTRHTNLQPTCRRSHQIKDEGYIDVRTHPDGTLDWRDTWGGQRTVPPAITIKHVDTDLGDDCPF